MKKRFWTVVEEIIRKSDVVLEVLDARFPELTRIAKIEKYASFYRKPLILIINKSDLISETTIETYRRAYSGMDIAIISAKKLKGMIRLIKKIKSKTKVEAAKVAIIGYPNTGKSSLINKLSKGARTHISSESGCTRGLQLISGKYNLRLFDTPGIIPFNEKDEVMLGLFSGINPAKLNNPDIVAYKLISLFIENNPAALEKAYGVDPKIGPEDFLIELGKKKNMLLKGGIVDERRAAIQFLIDWHKGKMKL